MGLFSDLKKKIAAINAGSDINEEVIKLRQIEGAVLLDCRSAPEYERGHIKGSINLPVDNIYKIVNIAPDKATPLFLYCYSGARSESMAADLRKMGYTDVNNIGGIIDWEGKKVIS